MGGAIPLHLRFKPSLRTRRGTSGEIVLVSRTGTVRLPEAAPQEADPREKGGAARSNPALSR